MLTLALVIAYINLAAIQEFTEQNAKRRDFARKTAAPPEIYIAYSLLCCEDMERAPVSLVSLAPLDWGISRTLKSEHTQAYELPAHCLPPAKNY